MKTYFGLYSNKLDEEIWPELFVRDRRKMHSRWKYDQNINANKTWFVHAKYVRHCSLIVIALDIQPEGDGFESWPWDDVVPLGKTLHLHFPEWGILVEAPGLHVYPFLSGDESNK